MSLVSEGYVYVSSEDAGVLAHARAGMTISLQDRRPPWIVVDHSIGSIIVARWPGKLWRVRVADVDGIEQASVAARYTRAFSVEIIDGIPVSRLFGERGEAVCSVIEKATNLELSQIQLLARARDPAAADAYSRTWNDWLAAVGESAPYRDEDLRGTLAIPAGGSPVQCGLTVLYQTISKRAADLAGSSAFIVDDDGNKYLEPTWSAAAGALLEAAMAFGAPLVSDSDRLIMSKAWHLVFGADTKQS